MSEQYLQLAGKQEIAGQLSLALLTLQRAQNDQSRIAIQGIISNNIHRLIGKVKRLAQSADFSAIPLFEHGNNPRHYIPKVDHNGNIAPLISLTTISTRISRILRTIDSLEKQTAALHSINLYISSGPFLLDEGIPETTDILKEIAAKGVNIYYVNNIGPYRKQFPIIFQLRLCKASGNTPIITVDDDVIYPPDIISKLSFTDNAAAIVAHRGREISLNSDGRIATYGSFEKPRKYSSIANMGTGKNGIRYELKHFPTQQSDYVGPVLAPTADDIWCKWVTASYCVPTIILEPEAAYNPKLDFAESAPEDKNGLFHKYNAKGVNDEAIRLLELFFSVSNRGLEDIIGASK